MSRRRRDPAPVPQAVDSTAARLPGPQRTCVGCRAKVAKTDLLRVVGAEGPAGEIRLTPDPAGRLPGRGASVHPDPRCVDLAEKRRAFPRALRLDGPLDVTPVREYVAGTAKAADAGPQTPTRSGSPR